MVVDFRGRFFAGSSFPRFNRNIPKPAQCAGFLLHAADQDPSYEFSSPSCPSDTQAGWTTTPRCAVREAAVAVAVAVHQAEMIKGAGADTTSPPIGGLVGC
ncbi:hypothetical protein [Lysobacter fragariae]